MTARPAPMLALTLEVPADREVTTSWDLAEAHEVSMQIVNEGGHEALVAYDPLAWLDGPPGVQTIAPGGHVVLRVRRDATEIELPISSPEGTVVRVGPCAYRRRPGGALDPGHEGAWRPAPTQVWISR